MSKFSNVAGPKLNLNKTECLLTGTYVNTFSNDNHIHGVKIAKNVKCLGVYLGHDKEICYTGNWTNKLEKLEKILSVWKRRNLTIFGKCTIVNTLAISKLVYNAFILPNPKPEFFKQVSKIIYNFLWKKRDRIKRNTLIGKIDQGGIGIVDIENKFQAVKASWIKRLVDKESITHILLNKMLKKINMSVAEVLKTTDYKYIESDLYKISIPHFYGEVFTAFNKCKKCKNINALKKDEFFAEIIWNNNLFQYKSKPLFLTNWIKSGIKYIKELFNDNGEIYDLEYFTNKIEKNE